MIEKSPIKFVWNFVKKLKWLFIIYSIALFSNEFLIRYVLVYASELINLVSSFIGENKNQIKDIALKLVFIIATIELIKAIINNSLDYLEAIIAPKVISVVVKDIFKSTHKLSPNFFINNMSGEISSKIISVWNSSLQLFFSIFYGALKNIIGIAITIYFFFSIHNSLGYFALTSQIIYVYVMIKCNKYNSISSTEYHRSKSKLSGFITDSVSNAILVKSFSAYSKEEKEFINEVAICEKTNTKSKLVTAKIFTFHNLMTFFVSIMIWIFAINLWIEDNLTTTQFIFATGLISTLLTELRYVTYMLDNLFTNIGALKNGLELLSQEIDVKDAENAKNLEITNGEIKLESINYKYNEKKINIFTDLNLSVSSKEKVGIVGRSGSGKSTLIKLILRYFDTSSGDIIIDGQKIKDITQESLHKNIGLIPQEASLFNRSIMENIRYGRVDATDEEVMEAAKKAFAHEFIMETPHGYESVVGEKGIKLSGGERQRIAIARAILKNSPILILDEATSSLDSESEVYIQKSMTELMKDKTVIVIAHRLSTLKNMDRLVIMNKGEIKEEGTHNSLLRKKGIYHKLYSMQVDGFIGIEDGDIKKTG